MRTLNKFIGILLFAFCGVVFAAEKVEVADNTTPSVLVNKGKIVKDESVKEDSVEKDSDKKKDDRPEKWGVPLTETGIENLHQISKTLYRSAQPTDDDFKKLHKMGIKTVINLRTFHSDKDEMGDLDFNYEQIRINAWKMKDEYVEKFLNIVTDKEKQPVLVHCQHGADRTGTMVAIYRIAVCGWEKEEAIREMKEGGYNFHSIWKNLPEYIMEFDINRLKLDESVTKNLLNKDICVF